MIPIVGHVKVALTFYHTGAETTFWEYMPAMPQPGDTIHYSLNDEPGNSRAWHVRHVSWATEGSEWYAEVTCG